ncbi:MAG: hypothetical protein OEW84_07240, partial [Aigarchaeota archaeon]|nr:hypothetical protein [Aigarchaeota archaeon]
AFIRVSISADRSILTRFTVSRLPAAEVVNHLRLNDLVAAVHEKNARPTYRKQSRLLYREAEDRCAGPFPDGSIMHGIT